MKRTPAIDSSAAMRTLLDGVLIWDNHACMPLRADAERFLPQLERYREAGVTAVTLNVGFDALPWYNTLAVLAHFRRWLSLRVEDYLLVEAADDVERARDEGRLAVSFDIEGGSALNGQLDMVQLYYQLGVRWMLIAYNQNNALGGGCNSAEDPGLTPFGQQVLDEMARVGMVVCCSHTGHRTARQVMERAGQPVVLSHSNAAAVWPHFRNVPDSLIRDCAATDGVVGINGVGQFLGPDGATVDAVVRHIDYMVGLVGSRHVALALDHVFDLAELQEIVSNNAQMFRGMVDAGAEQFLPPEKIREIAGRLHGLGYAREDLLNILGANHLRVARRVWK